MELSQLNMFQEVAHCGEMKRASDTLRCSPSTISKAISGLEADLGYSLFDRTQKKLVLTAAGREFLIHVKKAMIELDTAKVKGMAAATEADAIINVGSSIPWFMNKAISEFLSEHPQTTLNTFNANASRLCGMLMKKQICYSITYEKTNDVNIESIFGMSEDCYVLSGKKLNNSNDYNISLADLSDANWAKSATNTAWASIEDQFFSSAAYTPKVRFRGLIPQINSINLLLNTDTICIIPAHIAFNIYWGDTRKMLYYYKLSDSYTYLTLWISSYKAYSKSKLETDFYDKLRASLSEIEDTLNNFAVSDPYLKPNTL